MQFRQEEQLLTRYLLGEFSVEEEEELEERLCLDSDLFERMLAHRDHLIDDYHVGRLSDLQRQHFEQHFMGSPEQRERVEMAQALLEVFAAERKAQALIVEQAEPSVVEHKAETPIAVRVQLEPVSWWQRPRDLLRSPQLAFGMAMVVMLLFLGILWVVFDSRQRELQQEIAKERGRADRLEAEVKLAQQMRETPSPHPVQVLRPEPNLIASADLPSDFNLTDRGQVGSGGKLALPSSIQLRLKLRDYDYRSYRVTIRELSSNQIVWQRDGLKAQTTKAGKVVVVTPPANRFASVVKDYFATLDGRTAEGKYEEGVDKYSFQVEKK